MRIIALEALHAGGGKSTAQVGIFPGAFSNAPPARVARDIHHRRKGPVNPGGSGLARGDFRRAARYVRLPGAGFRQRNGENGAVTMDHVQPKEEGDAQARLFHSDLLQAVGLRRPLHAQVRPHRALADPLLVKVLLHLLMHLRVGVLDQRGNVPIAGEGRPHLVQLPGFLAQRHLREESRDPGFDFRIEQRVLVHSNTSKRTGRIEKKNLKG